MDKTRRNFRLYVGVTNASGVVTETIEIKPPFTVEFDVQRNTLASTNVASIRIYNLAETTRKKIYKDVFRYDVYKPVQLKAGYGDNMPTIFKGNIKQAWSVREGVNYITTIEAYDGGDAFINSVTNENFPANTRTSDMLQKVMETLRQKNVEVGAIGAYDDFILRGNAVSGNSSEILKALSGDGFFVDLEKSYCLKDEECIRGQLQIIDSAAGLLGTPVRTETYLNFEMIFEPRILIGQLIQLKSVTERNFNGFYKVLSVKHHGMISEAVCGSAVTSVGLWYGTKSLTVVN